MTYRQTLDYLYSRLPVFQRIGQAAYKADLSNTYALCEIIEHPEKELKAVHVGGTNGKGSVSHMIASILQEAGYKVGLYTSPHLKDFRERIRINGKMISREAVIKFVEQNKKEIEKIEPSFFEWTVALAFNHFRKKKTDINVIEVGMGGRLDSTNVITPEVSVITNISLDHKQFLGDTLEKIAYEKAGIIKEGIPVVIGEKQKETTSVFKNTSTGKKSHLIFASDRVIQEKYSCELKGDYQPKNIRTVIAAIDVLREQGWLISDSAVKKGIAKVVTNTGLRGRWETISKKPRVICDIGHNEAGIKEVVKQLKNEKYDQLHFVLGVAGDKDIDGILKQLPKKARYYFTNANIPRAMKASELKDAAFKHQLMGDVFQTVRKALNGAKKRSGPNDLVFVGGSAFVVAEAID